MKPLLVARIEVRAESSSLAEVLRDASREFQLAPAAASPPGYHWFDIEVDAERCERGAALTAPGVLSDLVDRGANGRIEDFRILCGQQWLQVGPATVSNAHPWELGDLGFVS